MLYDSVEASSRPTTYLDPTWIWPEVFKWQFHYFHLLCHADYANVVDAAPNGDAPTTSARAFSFFELMKIYMYQYNYTLQQ